MEWAIDVFVMPRRLEDGALSFPLESLAWRDSPGGEREYRRPTKAEIEADREMWF